MNEMCDCPPEAGAEDCESRNLPSRGACPTNHQVGKALDSLTLKAMLAVPLTALRSTEYLFCPDPQCATVYYSADGTQLFDEITLRDQVYQKHPREDEVLVCYCFRHTIGSIWAELRATGMSTVVDSINKGIQEGKCACDIRNPQGSCCLGNVRALIKQLRRELGAA